MQLLERDIQLRILESALGRLGSAGGSIVLVSGEAGIGKTALVEAFTAQGGDSMRVFQGRCNALITPRPLGPLLEIARQTGGPLRARIEAAAPRSAIFAASLEELRPGSAPTVVVVEDLHWADEATIRWLQFLGRRVQRAEALLVATYCDLDVGPEHPLRSLLRDLPSEATVHCRLTRLTETAVATLAHRYGCASDRLHAITGGNPFFLTELLAATGWDPAEIGIRTVRDAVFARSRGLSTRAREVIELVSVVPGFAERWLVDTATHADPETIAECVASGLLRVDGDALAFRHELARRAVEGALAPDRSETLHAEALRAWSHAAPETDLLARLVHHAVGAGDERAVLEHAPRAARQAAALAAHREAASHYATALRHAKVLPAEERATLLESYSHECYVTDQIEDALSARQAAVQLRRRLDQPEAIGANLRWISRLSWFLGRREDAERFADEAIVELEALPPGPELAMAYSNRSQLYMLAQSEEAAIRWAKRAIALAESLGVVAALIHALNNLGAAEGCARNQSGVARLERSLALALKHDFPDHAARAYTNLCSCAISARQYGRAARLLEEGISYTREHDFGPWNSYLLSWRARARFEQGDWDGADDDVARVLDRGHASAVVRIPALAVRAHLRVRRGGPAPSELLGELLQLAVATGELQRIGPAILARAESAWLDDKLDGIVGELEAVYDLARQRATPWEIGALALWLWRAGRLRAEPDHLAEPFALQIRGDWRGAAGAWARIGCPYEEALAWADGDDAACRLALRMFERLGATPAAARVHRRLRAPSVRTGVRGPRPSTRENLAGLTRRELDVLALVALGLTNAEIAGRLFISVKTTDHHVSAILAKFQVASRRDAVRAARRSGVLGDSGDARPAV